MRPVAECRMSTEQKSTDQTALGERLGKFWGNFKQGKIISYKWMAILLIAGAAIGVTWYILSGWRSATSKRWMELDEARSPEALREFADNPANANTIQAKLADLQIARGLLGEGGIELLGAGNTELRTLGVSNIEKSREMFQKLLDVFKDDPVFKPQCLLGLAKAEAALVAVPTTPGQLTEFKGKVPKVIEYLDQLAEASAPDTPWATDSKKLADTLRTKPDEFVAVQRAVFSLQPPTLPGLPKTDGNPFGPISGLPGGK
jgi:hypothetical protein